MKKFILLVLSLLFITAFGFAQRTDLSGMTIVIDPGHGGYTAWDRQTTIPGISVAGQNNTYFWESVGNWSKANHLKPMLEALGANVILTREHNNYQVAPSGNEVLPTLQTRYRVADDNNADWFHSIHSNGGGGQYTVTIYWGFANNSAPPRFPEAVTMCNIMAARINRHNRTSRGFSTGDYGFAGDGTYHLGVLGSTQTISTLSEGSFHDYEPETRRLMNDDYRKNEAYALRNSFMEYFGVPADTLCIIAGIVSDISIVRNVNYVKVILAERLEEPVVNRTYIGDQYYNGYYFFDNVLAGDYQLIFETEGYPKDTVDIVLTPGQLRFVDRTTANTIPAVPSTPIIDGNTNTSVTASFTFNFTKVMDRASVQAATSLTPTADVDSKQANTPLASAVECSFTWSNNDMTVRVTPTMPLQSKTYYTLEIDGSAKDIVGIEIGEPFVRNFTTLVADEERPKIIATYPANNDTNVPIIGTITIAFDKPMDTTSLKNAISLRRGSNNNVERQLWFNTINNQTIVTLKTVENLEPNNALYILVITTDAKDITDNAMRTQANYTFRTADKTYKNPTMIDNFQSVAGWYSLSPSSSGQNAGLLEGTSSALATDIYYPPLFGGSNTSSRRINYNFNPDAASHFIRDYYNTTNPTVALTPSLRLQSYVFGDGSQNEIRFCIRNDVNGTGGYLANEYVTIDWYGWRLLEWDLTAEPGIKVLTDVGDPPPRGNIRFDSYQWRYNRNVGNTTGTVYFDELKFVEVETATSSVPELLPENIPSVFSLEQNYPNPFNPSTNLHLNISEIAKIKLVVYDVLGREVSVLKDEIMNPGIYKVTWDATGIPSGTYFAKLYSGKNISTIKMLLAK